MFWNIILVVLVVDCIVFLAIFFFCLLFWLLFRFLDSTTNCRASKVLQGRKIFVGHSGDYYMVVESLQYYFAQLQAIIVKDDSSNAEFQLILEPEVNPMVIL